MVRKLYISFIVYSCLFFCVNYASANFSKQCTYNSPQYKVIKVFDGDTILISSREKDNIYKIRFLGIDAFEHNQAPYGGAAKDFLTKKLLNKNVCIETDVQEKDKYGRTLGYVFLNNKKSRTLINEEVLKTGYAILFDFPPNIKYLNILKNAQVYARENMNGVWSMNDYIFETPAEFRRKEKKLKKKKIKKIKKNIIDLF